MSSLVRRILINDWRYLLSKSSELIGEGRDKAIRGVHAVLVPVFVEEEGCGEAMIILQFATQALCYCGLAYSGGSLQPDKTTIPFGQMRSDELPNVDSRVFCTLFLGHGVVLGLGRIQSLEGFLKIQDAAVSATRQDQELGSHYLVPSILTVNIHP